MLPNRCHSAQPHLEKHGITPFQQLLALFPLLKSPSRTKQFCLGNSSCGISIIHFVLYCTWLLMLRYHFVSTFDNELCNLWRQCVPGGLLLIWYYSAGWGGCQGGLNKLFDYYIRESMVKNCICNI